MIFIILITTDSHQLLRSTSYSTVHLLHLSGCINKPLWNLVAFKIYHFFSSWIWACILASRDTIFACLVSAEAATVETGSGDSFSGLLGPIAGELVLPGGLFTQFLPQGLSKATMYTMVLASKANEWLPRNYLIFGGLISDAMHAHSYQALEPRLEEKEQSSSVGGNSMEITL